MTLLSLGRAFKLPAKLDVSTIIEPWHGSLPNISDEEHRHILKKLKIRPKDSFFKAFHFTTKKGPNGPAMANSIKDLTSLPQQTIEDIISMGGDELGVFIRKCFMRTPLRGLSFIEIWNTLYKKPAAHPRKLSFFSDKEGKTRVIGILDYWTQTALRPLHDTLMGILRGIKSDCTFDQNAFYTKLPSRGPYFSFDLSAATDRMPILLQKRIVSAVVGEERAEAWARLLTQLEFVNHKYPDKYFKYETGQPMGAYSSWAAMALTHHYIVQLAALRAGKRFFWDYCLLGDDIVIASEEVAVQYKILCSILDMPISEQKTHVSLDTYEFAKRWIYHGVEVTGFSIAGLMETWKRYSLLHEFLENQQLHGWVIMLNGRPGLISDIYNQFGRSPDRPVKLYILFYYIKNILKLLRENLLPSGELKDSSLLNPKLEYTSSALLAYISAQFGIHLHLPGVLGNSPASWEVVSALLQEIRVRIAEKDMDRVFENVGIITEKLDAPFREHYPDLADQAYRALRRECYPAIMCLNDNLRRQVDYLDRLALNDIEINIFELGIAKYIVSDDILSLRAAHSISLAESQMTKWFLYLARVQLKRYSLLVKGTDMIIPDLKDPEYYHPDALRRREALWRKLSANRKKLKSSLSNKVKK
nr:MAG: putative RNA dependent RNA polymerase [Zhejiang mito-like virus 6]